MSASEMERLREALREFGEHKVECGLWDCFYPDEITNGPIHDECTCGLAAALSGSSAPQAPNSLELLGEWFDWWERNRPNGAISVVLLNATRAALSMKSRFPEDAEGGSQKGSGR